MNVVNDVVQGSAKRLNDKRQSVSFGLWELQGVSMMVLRLSTYVLAFVDVCLSVAITLVQNSVIRDPAEAVERPFSTRLAAIADVRYCSLRYHAVLLHLLAGLIASAQRAVDIQGFHIIVTATMTFARSALSW